MSGSTRFDDSLWPLLISRVQGMVTDSQYEEYLARGTEYLQRGELYVSIVDVGQLAMPTVAQRQRHVEWMKRHGVLMREQLLGCALIITSPFIRLALSSILHIVPLPTPYVVVRDMAEGLEWATTRLTDAGLVEPAERIRRHFGPRFVRHSR